MAKQTTIITPGAKYGSGEVDWHFTFIDHSDEVLNALQKGINEALKEIGLRWVEHVKHEILYGYGKPIVDTGELINSMQFEVNIANKSVKVGSNAKHAPWVNNGTNKMPARPFLNSSIMNYIHDYENAVKSVLGSGWSVSASGLADVVAGSLGG